MVAYPIRAVPDADATWGNDLRDTIAGVNDHQTRITAIEQLPAAKGDVMVALANDTWSKIPAGTNGQVLTAQSGQTTGLQWAGSASETGTFVGDKTITGKFGVNATATTKQPVNMITSMSGSGVSGNQDKVAFALGANVTGNFSADTGSNSGFFWGLNLFATTGSTAGDGAGLTDIIGGLIEMSIQTPPGTTLPHVIGLQAEAAWFGATSGATVTQMESMRVSAPKRKDGASSGTATNVYGLFIEDVTAYNTGSSNSKFSLFVEGGISRLQGLVTVDNVVQSHNGTMTLQGDYSGNGKIVLTTNGIGFYGVTPVTRQTLVSSPTTTQIRTALIALGLVQ